MSDQLRQRILGCVVVVMLMALLSSFLLDGNGRTPLPLQRSQSDMAQSNVNQENNNQSLAQDMNVSEVLASDVDAKVSALQSIDLEQTKVVPDDVTSSVERLKPDVVPNTLDETKTSLESHSVQAVKPSVQLNKSLWALQVASFQHSTMARKLEQKLIHAQYPVYLKQKTLQDKSVFTQVFIGPLDSKQAAQKIQDQVKQVFKQQGLIVRYRP